MYYVYIALFLSEVTVYCLLYGFHDTHLHLTGRYEDGILLPSLGVSA